MLSIHLYVFIVDFYLVFPAIAVFQCSTCSARSISDWNCSWWSWRNDRCCVAVRSIACVGSAKAEINFPMPTIEWGTVFGFLAQNLHGTRPKSPSSLYLSCQLLSGWWNPVNWVNQQKLKPPLNHPTERPSVVSARNLPTANPKRRCNLHRPPTSWRGDRPCPSMISRISDVTGVSYLYPGSVMSKVSRYNNMVCYTDMLIQVSISNMSKLCPISYLIHISNTSVASSSPDNHRETVWTWSLLQ